MYIIYSTLTYLEKGKHLVGAIIILVNLDQEIYLVFLEILHSNILENFVGLFTIKIRKLWNRKTILKQ